MKKKIDWELIKVYAIFALFIVAVVAGIVYAIWNVGVRFTGNKDIFDTTYRYGYAQIAMPDGSVVAGDVDAWTDYDGDQLQVVIDGKTYLTHAENVVLIAEGK